MTINIDTLKTDISQEIARGAYRNTSHSPERRGDSVVSSYIESMTSLAEFVEKNAKDEKQQAVKQEVFDGLKDKYKDKLLSMLNAKSRCTSPMITGPANYPVRRAEKANATERKRADEWLEFSDNMEKYALKNLQNCYSKGEKLDTELDTYRKTLLATEAAHKNMVDANKILRNKKMMPEDKTYALRKMGFTDAAIQELLTPDFFMGRCGFPSFMLTNSNANIKRMRIRLKELEAKTEAREEKGNISDQREGLEILRNFEEDRLQLLFEAIPSEALRKQIKSCGFKWSPRNSAWQRKLTGNAMYSLKRLLKCEEFEQFKTVK